MAEPTPGTQMAPITVMSRGWPPRGVGPNRELGPPLKAGEAYTLVIGAGMTDLSGNPLPEPVYKRFRVADAVREPIAVEQWEIASPRTNSRKPLTLVFPRPLDRALLSHAIIVAAADGQTIDGQIAIDCKERRWRLTPRSPWAPGSYSVRVASGLEDVCGNSVIAAFDRPLRTGPDLAFETIGRSIPFCLVSTSLGLAAEEPRNAQRQPRRAPA